MRRSLLAVAIVAVLGAIWLQTSRASSFAVVQPHERAVVVSDGEVVATLSPGTHQYDARTQDVHVYPTSQREYRLPEPIGVDGCVSDVRIIWSIADVEAWHVHSGEADVGPALGDEVRRIARTFSGFGDDPRSAIQVFVNEQMDDFQVAGAARDLVIFSEPQC